MLQFAISSFVYSWLLFPPAWECELAPCTTCVCFDKKIYSHQKSYVAWDFCSFYALLVPHLATWSQHGHVCTHSVIVGILCDQTSPSAGHSLGAFTMSKTNHSTSADENLACRAMTLGPHITRWPPWFKETELARSQIYCTRQFIHKTMICYKWGTNTLPQCMIEVTPLFIIQKMILMDVPWRNSLALLKISKTG